MTVLKCKMCGGDLNIIEGQTVCECEYCGTKQTLPKLDNERKLALYDRASHFRRNNEFDKASAIYEQVLSEDNNDAETYWSLVLCRYGIEYVEDPASHKRIPTVNRAQYTSIFNDEDYKKAIELATVDQKTIYQQEAETIDNIQKGILEVSSKEEPFDIFICYKETDNNGRRTMDSVLAQDIYKELTNEDYKVFFSRITLEDKLGTAYEPYIFAALHSAKVMIVVGTRSEYFNAVWVKNEWSRYLSLIKKGEKKTLIPAYRDMDPYDLPEEFAYLQAQDMSKLGFMQDLTRGINKIVDADKKTTKETVIVNNQTTSNIAPLLERAQIFLEDKDFKSADEYCDRILDIDPKNADAYLGKALAEKHLSNIDQLIDYYKGLYSEDKQEKKTAVEEDTDHINDIVNKCSIDNYLSENEIREKYVFDRSYLSSLQNRVDQKQQIENGLKNDRLVSRLLAYCDDSIKNRFNEVLAIYADRIDQAKAEDERKISEIKDKYVSFLKDADASAEQMYSAALERKENDYQSYIKESDNIISIPQAQNLISKLKTLGEYKDAALYIETCNKKINELNEIDRKNKEIAAKKRKKTTITFSVIAAVLVILGIIYTTVLAPMMKYNKAVSLYENGNYASAYPLFNELGDYKDSPSFKEKAYPEYLKSFLGKLSVGDSFAFGAYEQDDNSTNGKETIEWIVLSKHEDRLLAISRYALDNQQYNIEEEDVTWETCSLRNWLDKSFYNDAFLEQEKQMICTSAVTADKNPDYLVDQGNDTQDKVFLLSIDEANKYFSSNSKRQCKATKYARSLGAYKNSSDGNCRWWLRTTSYLSIFAAGVDAGGDIGNGGFNIIRSDIAVRPAMWISLK